MWGGLSDIAAGLAERGANLLAELDERIEDDDLGDEPEAGPTKPRPVGEGSSDDDDDIDAVLPSWAGKADSEHSQSVSDPADSTSSQGDASASTDAIDAEKLHSLQQELAEVKAMREDIKSEVAQKMSQMSDDLGGALQTLSTGSGGDGGGHAQIDQALLARAEQAEKRLGEAEVAMQKLSALLQKSREKLQESKNRENDRLQLQALLQSRTEEAAQAEEALSALTKTHSAARVEMENQMSDLQSSARQEHEAARRAHEAAAAAKKEKEALLLQNEELLQQQRELEAEHAALLKQRAEAEATSSAEGLPEQQQLRDQLGELEQEKALQAELLEETRNELDARIAAEAALEHALKQEQGRSAALESRQNELEKSLEKAEGAAREAEARERAQIDEQQREKADGDAEQLAIAAQKLAEMQEELVQLKHENSQKSLEIESWAARLQQHETESEKRMAAMKEEIHSQAQQAAAAQAEAQLKAHKDQVDHHHVQLSALREDHEKEISDQMDVQNDLQKQLQEALDKHSSALHEVAASKRDQESLLVELENAESRCKIAETKALEQMKTHTAYAEDLTAQLALSLEGVQAASGEIEAANEKVSILEASQATLQAEKQAIQRLLDEATSEADVKSQHVEELEQRLAEYFSTSEGADSQRQRELEAVEANLTAAETEIQKVKSEKDELQNQVLAAEANVAASAASLETMKKTLKTSMERLKEGNALRQALIEEKSREVENRTEAEELLKVAQSELRAQTTAAEALEDQLQATQERMEELTHKYEEDLSAIRSRIALSETDSASSKSKHAQVVENLEAQMAEAEADRDAAQLAATSAQQAFAASQKEIEELKASSSEKERTLLASHDASLVALEQQHKEQLASVEAAQELVQGEISSLQSELADARADISSKESALHTLKEAAEAHYHTLNQAEEVSTASIKKIEAEHALQIEQLQSAIRTAEEESHRLQSDHEENLKRINSDFSEKSASWESVIAENQERLEECSLREASLLRDVEEKGREVDALRVELSVHTDSLVQQKVLNQQNADEQIGLRTQVAALERDVESRVVENASLHEVVRELRHEVQGLQSSQEATKQEANNKAAALEEKLLSAQQVSEEEVARLQNTIGNIEVALQRSRETNAELNQDISSLRDQLQNSTDECNVAVQRANDVESQLEKNEERRLGSLDTLKQLNHRIGDLQKQLVNSQEAQLVAEEECERLQQKLERFVPEEKLAALKKELSQAHELGQEQQAKYDRLLEQVEQSSEMHAGNVQGNELAASQLREELSTLKDSYAGLLEQSRQAAAKEVEATRQLGVLQQQLVSERTSSEAVTSQLRRHVSQIEEERTRLENEVHESSGSRHRRSTGMVSPSAATLGGHSAVDETASLVNSEFVDMEAGPASANFLSDLHEEQRKSSSPIPAAVAAIWRLAARHAPQLLFYIGDMPPRLSVPMQGFLVYFTVLHLLLLLRII